MSRTRAAVRRSEVAARLNVHYFELRREPGDPAAPVGILTGVDFNSVIVLSTTNPERIPADRISPGGGAPDREAALVFVDNGPVRTRYDGGTPGGAAGELLEDALLFWLGGKEALERFGCVRVQNSLPVLRVVYCENRRV